MTQLVFVNEYFAIEKIYFKGKPNKNIIGKVQYVKKAKELVWHLKFLPDYDLPIGFSKKRHDITAMKYNLKKSENLNNVLNVDVEVDGEKINTHVRHLTKRIEYMRPFYFQIMGWLEYISENEFSIKPIVIFR